MDKHRVCRVPGFWLSELRGSELRPASPAPAARARRPARLPRRRAAKGAGSGRGAAARRSACELGGSGDGGGGFVVWSVFASHFGQGGGLDLWFGVGLSPFLRAFFGAGGVGGWGVACIWVCLKIWEAEHPKMSSVLLVCLLTILTIQRRRPLIKDTPVWGVLICSGFLGVVLVKILE